MNSLDNNSMAMVREAAKIDKKGFKALIIGNDADNFSVGANVGLALFAANTAMWPLLEQNIKEGQDGTWGSSTRRSRWSARRAAWRSAGGCEVLLHCDAIQACGETYIGLVEAGVGLIPGWGGTKETVLRNVASKRRPGGPMPPVANALRDHRPRQSIEISGRSRRPLVFAADRRRHDESPPRACRRQGKGAFVGRRLRTTRQGYRSPLARPDRARRLADGGPWTGEGGQGRRRTT